MTEGGLPHSWWKVQGKGQTQQPSCQHGWIRRGQKLTRPKGN